MQLLLKFFVNAIRNGFDVCARVPFADDEKIGWSISQFAQVQLDDIFAFFVANALYYQGVELLQVGIGQGGIGGSGCTTQISRSLI